MSMLPYPVICYSPDCSEPAIYKIAARWSDGLTGELKTYYLSCEKCLPSLYRSAKRKRDACRLAPGESLEVPSIFQLARGDRDRQLVRCVDLEQQLA